MRVPWIASTALACALIACGPPAPLTPSPPSPTGSEGSAAPTPTENPALGGFDTSKPPTAEEAKAFILDVNAGYEKVASQEQRAGWINENFITDDTDALAGDASEATMAYLSAKIKESVRYLPVLKELPPDLQRQFMLLRIAGTVPAPSDPKERSELATLTVKMKSEYGSGKYCSEKLKAYAGKESKDSCLTLGQLSDVLKKSQNWDELVEAWKGWRTVSVQMRPQFQRYVELGNKGAAEIGFKDVGDLWRSGYDMSPADFENEVERLWTQVKPLYDDLHCYVRKKLRTKWGKEKIPEKAPIPAHVLGNMWSQSWENIESLVQPYPGAANLDVTRGLVAKNYTTKMMVKSAEDFFVSLGMKTLPETFWSRSLFDKPRDREVECHASAWDIDLRGDVRVKVCAEPNEIEFITLHHELGHDYYFLAYDHLAPLFRNGANDGFHEGIGDTLALSVTPGYLKKLGILGDVPSNDKADMNVLMHKALEKVSFLPFGKMIDQWRWEVFSGKTRPDQYNKAWYDLILKYQGVAPPEARDESTFDPGAKYHVPANVPYMRYFLAAIYQFQFHRALCKAAGETGPLFKCSIYGNKEAGAKLSAMLKLGASVPWPEAMKAISGETSADATAILDYFKPLDDWLKEQNKGEQCGW
ncbi:MAG: M2 family metallopeptidase [Polyangiaceae bacterium]